MTPPPGRTVLRGVDRAVFAAALTARLRAAGVPVGLTATEDLVRALAAVPPLDRGRLYWVARTTLVRRREELAAFDDVFGAVFADDLVPLTASARRGVAPAPAADDALAQVPGGDHDEVAGGGLPWVTLPSVVGTGDDEGADLLVPLLRASDLERLSDVPFEQLAPHEVEQLGRWLADGVGSWPTRRSRRRRPGRPGHQVALRRTLARARRTGWEAVDVVKVSPVPRRRRVVVLCDVSQSVQAQVPAFLQLARALTTTLDGEAFAFGTGLTRLTPVLRNASAARAVELVTEQVTDRFGGTRIASSLEALLASHHADAVRGGVVVIASDGWDSEPPERVERAMARLRRRAHRVVWVNPRAAAPGFAPLVGTMAAALPYCDDLLPADDFRSLATVIDVLCRPRRPVGGVLSSTG